MNNPRILFIAPSSYPIFGAEANVNAKVLKVLSENGAKIHLVSRSVRKNANVYPESIPNSYFSKVESINLVKTQSGKNFKTLFKHILAFAKFGYVYRGIDWAFDALPVCESLLKHYKFDFIYTYNQPSEVLGLYLSRKYDIKHVATWNDPYIWNKYPVPYGKGIDWKISRNRAKLVCNLGLNTFRHIFPSIRLKNYMKKYMDGINEENSVICPHIMFEKKAKKREQNTILRLIHSGAIGKERNPMRFFKAVKRLVSEIEDIQIEVTFIGVVERYNKEELEKYITDYDLNKYIRFLPSVAYDESIDMLKDYDCSIILEASCEEGIFLPSKVADYMQMDIPIFSISPKIGVLNDLFKKNKIEYFADCTDIEDIYNALKKIYFDFLKGELKKSSPELLFSPSEIFNSQKTKIWNHV